MSAAALVHGVDASIELARERERRVIVGALRAAVREKRSDLLAEGWALAARAGIVDPSALVRPFERAYHFRRNEDGGGRRNGGGGSRRLDLLSPLATYTRSSEAARFTRAATDGSTPFLDWPAANVIRVENRGDGLGEMVLLEGARTNVIAVSRNPSHASWTAGTAAPTVGQASPDGAALAWRTSAASGQFGNYVAGLGAAGTVVGSAFMRRGAALTSWQTSTQGVSIVAAGSTSALADAYQRFEIKNTTGINAYNPVDGRDWSANAGIVAGARDVIIDLPQVEVGQFPSSPIRTSGVAATRGGDNLDFAAGVYPDSFRTRGFAFYFAPDFLPSDMHAAGAGQSLIGGLGGVANAVLLSYNIAADPARIYVDNTTKSTGPFSWIARGQRMRFEIRPSRGTVTISGATAGNGTHNVGAWTIAAGSVLNVGRGSVYSFGRWGRYLEAL